MKVLQSSFLILGFVLFCPGQNKAKVCGTIADDVGAIIPDAKVEIKLNNKKTFVTYSDENGEFNIEIPTGIYKISISADSFKESVLKNQVIDSESECFTFKLKSNIPSHQIT
jgi:uncharacterized GH25 family protein